MDPLIDELRQQFHFTLGMYQSVLEACTDDVWVKAFPGEAYLTFWREAYHTIFWIHNYLGSKDKTFEMMPFGKDIDPQLFTPPNNTCDRAEVLEYAAQTQAYVDDVFGSMTREELSDPGHYDETSFRSVYHRLMYGLRHGMYHTGRLAAYLDQQGIQADHWQG